MNTRSFEVYWQAYNSVNQMFANLLLKQCRVSVRDAIWVHDYHLFLLPAMIVQSFKKLHGGGKPGMVTFCHSPWPSSELLRPFPHAREIMRGVVHSDLVGFHDFGSAQHFITCAKRMLGLTTSANRGGNISLNFKGRVVMVTTNHAGVDVQYLTELTRQPEVKRQVAELKQRHAGKTLIGAIDDLERNSGMSLKLLAFEQLLTEYPVYQDRVVLVLRSCRAHDHAGTASSTSPSKPSAERGSPSYQPTVHKTVKGTDAISPESTARKLPGTVGGAKARR
jgi:trehalose 6-phosphate synthase/phosphatase